MNKQTGFHKHFRFHEFICVIRVSEWSLHICGNNNFELYKRISSRKRKTSKNCFRLFTKKPDRVFKEKNRGHKSFDTLPLSLKWSVLSQELNFVPLKAKIFKFIKHSDLGAGAGVNQDHFELCFLYLKKYLAAKWSYHREVLTATFFDNLFLQNLWQ